MTRSPSLPDDWQQLSTPCGRSYYVDNASRQFHFAPPANARAERAQAVPAESFLRELADMFPSWDEAALRVVEANGDDREATISQLLSWTDDDAGAAATAQDAPREPPPVLRRDVYDDVMAKRLAATIPPEATGAFLRAVSKFKSLAKHAHDKAPREHRPSFVLRAAESQRIVHAATREDRIAAGVALLEQRLRHLSLKSVDMVDDGNCQFRAISMELYNTQAHHAAVGAAVRKNIIAYLRSHEDAFSVFVGDAAEWGGYLSRMAMDRSWGDELTLQAACAAYDVDIFVITTEASNFHLPYRSPSASETPRRLFLSHVSPIHYNVVAPSR
ncbi:thiol-dependent ubiquitin-specific protease [Aureococcus anophagefferens]|nr:thiol-dependent ubiquitin-specific protease [Aureococcus anophagefferens]